jgi:putative membrane protein insertion efficiency factor
VKFCKITGNGEMKQLKTIAANVFYFLIQLAKRIFLMPIGTCRHIPSCSQFAREAIIELPLHKAIFRIVLRVLRCNPFVASGYDPVIKEKSNSIPKEK